MEGSVGGFVCSFGLSGFQGTQFPDQIFGTPLCLTYRFVIYCIASGVSWHIGALSTPCEQYDPLQP